MVHLPARDIPVPTSVSPEAQATLSMGRLGPPPREYPALDDVAGWKAFVAEADGFVQSMIGDPTAGFTGTIKERDIGPCPLYVLTPEGARTTIAASTSTSTAVPGCSVVATSAR